MRSIIQTGVILATPPIDPQLQDERQEEEEEELATQLSQEPMHVTFYVNATVPHGTEVTLHPS